MVNIPKTLVKQTDAYRRWRLLYPAENACDNVALVGTQPICDA